MLILHHGHCSVLKPALIIDDCWWWVVPCEIHRNQSMTHRKSFNNACCSFGRTMVVHSTVMSERVVCTKSSWIYKKGDLNWYQQNRVVCAYGDDDGKNWW
jgi:hypothetical protein